MRLTGLLLTVAAVSSCRRYQKSLMITRPKAIEIAAEILRLKSELEKKLGPDFEKEILIYVFLHDKPDPEISEALSRYRGIEWALCRFLQEQDSVPKVENPEFGISSSPSQRKISTRRASLILSGTRESRNWRRHSSGDGGDHGKTCRPTSRRSLW